MYLSWYRVLIEIPQSGGLGCRGLRAKISELNFREFELPGYRPASRVHT